MLNHCLFLSDKTPICKEPWRLPEFVTVGYVEDAAHCNKCSEFLDMSSELMDLEQSRKAAEQGF